MCDDGPVSEYSSLLFFLHKGRSARGREFQGIKGKGDIDGCLIVYVLIVRMCVCVGG